MASPRQRSNHRPAERRQITLLFCDLVGSTSLSERLDPEDVLRAMRAYQDACQKQLSRFGGHVSRTIGDGILAFFGYPAAHEDDPDRALHAALSIVSEISRLRIDVGAGRTIPLAVRIAVHTGLVVVATATEEAGADQMDVFGRVPNIAARLQSLAAPNSIIIGSETHKRVSQTFQCRYLGAASVKGSSQPLKTWAVEGVRQLESRLEATRGSQLTTMVGRQDELALLKRLWQQAQGGDGQLALLSGDPGVGKSRLIRALRETVAEEAPAILFYQCSPFHTNTPLHPIVDQVRRTAGFLPDDSPQTRLGKLRAVLATATDSVASVLPTYCSLLSLQPPGRRRPSHPGSLTARMVQKTLAQVTFDLTERRPVLMVVEDFQWLDPTSTEVLDLILQKLPDARMLVILSGRPSAQFPRRARQGTTSISLGTLSRADTIEMIGKITRGKPLPGRVLSGIVDRTDGNPLYVEEFTRAVLESGMLKDLGTRFDLGRSISALSVPATIQDSLMARLDSLGDAKRTLQIAAVIGRSFSVGMVSALTDTAKEESLRAFNRLEVSGLLIKSGSGGYRFKHAMIRDAAYDSLLRTERQALHQQIARLLEEGGPSDDPGQIALLAYHYSQAGQRERAIPHWLHAGVTALRYSSHREAIAHFREGIEFLRSQAPTPARQRQEIEFQINLAHAYTAIEGWAGARVEKAYRRARDLAERYGSLRQQLLVSWGLWVARLVASDLRKSRELADHLLALASASGDRPTELMANCAALVSHFFLGNLRTARAHAEKVCEQYDLRSDGRLVWTFQHDPKVVALVYLGHLHWLLGQPREARAAARQARKHAEKLGHPFMLSFALILGASDYLYERDLHRHMACVQRGVALADERGLSMFKVFGPLWASEAIVSRDPREATLEELSALLDSLLGRKMHLQAPVYQALLATQYSRMGNEARAKKLTRSALTLLKRTGEKWFEPELCRIMGEIEVARVRPNYKAAEGHFKRALALSRRMGAVGWEVRAVRSFADLRLRQGKIGGARRMVESVSKRYPPGQSCADLRECQPYLNAATTGAVADPSAMNA